MLFWELWELMGWSGSTAGSRDSNRSTIGSNGQSESLERFLRS